MNQEKKKTIQSFTDLDAWKEGHKLVILMYRETELFPQKEIFALTKSDEKMCCFGNFEYCWRFQ